jgi:hypothetical protein
LTLASLTRLVLPWSGGKRPDTPQQIYHTIITQNYLNQIFCTEKVAYLFLVCYHSIFKENIMAGTQKKTDAKQAADQEKRKAAKEKAHKLLNYIIRNDDKLTSTNKKIYLDEKFLEEYKELCKNPPEPNPPQITLEELKFGLQELEKEDYLKKIKPPKRVQYSLSAVFIGMVRQQAK